MIWRWAARQASAVWDDVDGTHKKARQSVVTLNCVTQAQPTQSPAHCWHTQQVKDTKHERSRTWWTKNTMNEGRDHQGCVKGYDNKGAIAPCVLREQEIKCARDEIAVDAIYGPKTKHLWRHASHLNRDMPHGKHKTMPRGISSQVKPVIVMLFLVGKSLNWIYSVQPRLQLLVSGSLS